MLRLSSHKYEFSVVYVYRICRIQLLELVLVAAFLLLHRSSLSVLREFRKR